MKKWLSLVLALLMVLSLAACGNTPAEEDAKDPESPEYENPEYQEVLQDKPDGKVGFDYRVNEDDTGDWFVTVYFWNKTSDVFNQEARVIVTDDADNILARESLTIEILPNNVDAHEIRCKGEMISAPLVDVQNMDVLSELNTETVFPITSAEFADDMHTNIEAFSTEPALAMVNVDKNNVKTLQYAYNVYDWIDVFCYEAEVGQLKSVTLITSTDKITDTDRAGEFGGTLASLISYFEPDESTLAQVDADLDIVNQFLTEGTMNFASGSIAEYMYMVNDKTIMLSITPK